MKNDRIVVVGATGYIGRQLLAAGSGGDIKMVGLSSRIGDGGLPPLDLAHAEAFDYAGLTPRDTIILCAAISSPDRCAREAAYAEAVNVAGTSAFIDGAIDRGARVVFLSSDTVYGETRHAVSEDDPCHPVGEYGRMKYAVEQRFAANDAVRVARLSYVLSRHDKFSEYLARCAENGLRAEIFHPFYRRVIYAGDVVAGLLALARNWSGTPHRIVNFAGPALVSRLDIAEATKRHALPDLAFDVVEPDEEFFVDRPRTIDMTSSRLEAVLGRVPLSIDEAIESEIRAETQNSGEASEATGTAVGSSRSPLKSGLTEN